MNYFMFFSKKASKYSIFVQNTGNLIGIVVKFFMMQSFER